MVADGPIRTSSRVVRSSSTSTMGKAGKVKAKIQKNLGKGDLVQCSDTKNLTKREDNKNTNDSSSSSDPPKNASNKKNSSNRSGRNQTDKSKNKQEKIETSSGAKKDSKPVVNGDSKKKEKPLKIKNESKSEKLAEKKEKHPKQKKSKEKTTANSYASLESNDEEEYDFSKIENMIFEGHTAKKTTSLPEKAQRSSEKTKGRSKKSASTGSKDDGVTTKTPKKSHQEKEGDKSKHSRSKKHKSSPHKGKTKKKAEASDSDDSDWEEVEESAEINELEALLDDSQDTKILPQGSVKIELDAPDVVWGMKKRKKRRTEEEMVEEYLRKHVNRSIKESFENMHKAHLLCIFAQGQYVNKTLNSEVLLGSALSIITDKNAYPPKRLDMNYLEKFVNWFSRKITLKNEDVETDYWNIPLETLLAKRFENKKALTNRELIFMFIVICRALGMNVRLVLSLQPLSWKPTAGALIKQIKEEKNIAGAGGSSSKPSDAGEAASKPSCSKMIDKIDKEAEVKKEPNLELEKTKAKNKRRMLSSDSDHDQRPKKKAKTKKSRSTSLSDDSGSDFDPVSFKIKNRQKSFFANKSRNSTDSCNQKDKKRKSNEKEDKQKKKKKSEPLIEWAEIYVEEEEKWICIDVVRSKIHCIPEIESRTPSSSAYITAFNGDLTVKDVTRRYIASWLSNEKKLRCCTKWWGKALRGFRGKRTRLDKEEDEEMDQNLRQQPLPKSIGEYKNHPLYALQRHLLKFEAIYPPDESPVGYIRSEPVYPRSSVYTLCSRDTWMKEAKTVRVGEEPYKIVKARPKWDRNTCQVIKDRPLEVFGEWQVEDFEPPVASGGKVPRNDYGNVELFKPSMLPKGCVHLPIAGLSRIAKKLSIDCAPAMTGFDFHSGWSHPVYEGYVICEEFRDILMDAWNEDQVEQARREAEKREKRIYNNWKKLIHGMMVRERVREQYGSYEVAEDEEKEEATKEGDEATSEEKGKGKGKKGKKNSEQKKPKVTQGDIDAARPSHLSQENHNLQIDLTSNVVEMAKASRKSTMKTKNSANAKVSQRKDTDNKGSLGDSSDETDEEEKKQKIRAILKWGTRTVNTAPNLSDESDNEDNEELPSGSNLWKYANLDFPIKPKTVKRKRRKNSGSEESAGGSASDNESVATSRSTTPEPDENEVLEVTPKKRISRRSTVKKVAYEESDDGDISLDDSDVEDKTYNPVKPKKDDILDLNLSESD